MRLTELRHGGVGHFLIPDTNEAAVIKFHGGGITEIAADAVFGNGEGFGPGRSLVSADPGLIAKGLAAVTVGHEKAVVAEPEQV